MIDETECENNTETIRQLKHSVLIRDDIRKIEKARAANPGISPACFFEMCQEEASFLYNRYMDIFSKVVKQEIDLVIMTRLLTVLKCIEDGKVDQHEGSVMFGKILKELYIDSAVKTADNLDKANAEPELAPPEEGKAISWKDYKTASANIRANIAAAAAADATTPLSITKV